MIEALRIYREMWVVARAHVLYNLTLCHNLHPGNREVNKLTEAAIARYCDRYREEAIRRLS